MTEQDLANKRFADNIKRLYFHVQDWGNETLETMKGTAKDGYLWAWMLENGTRPYLFRTKFTAVYAECEPEPNNPSKPSGIQTGGYIEVVERLKAYVSQDGRVWRKEDVVEIETFCLETEEEAIRFNPSRQKEGLEPSQPVILEPESFLKLLIGEPISTHQITGLEGMDMTEGTSVVYENRSTAMQNIAESFVTLLSDEFWEQGGRVNDIALGFCDKERNIWLFSKPRPDLEQDPLPIPF